MDVAHVLPRRDVPPHADRGDATRPGDADTAGRSPTRAATPSAVASIHLIDDSLNKFYTLKDLEVVEASDKWFVRKVAPPGSDTLLDWLDEHRSRPGLHGVAAVQGPAWEYATVVIDHQHDGDKWTVAALESADDDALGGAVAVGDTLRRSELLNAVGAQGYEAFGVHVEGEDTPDVREVFYLKRSTGGSA